MCRFDDGLDDHSTKAFPITAESSHYFWSLGESKKLHESDDDKSLEASQRSATLEAAEIQRQQQEEHAEQMRQNTKQPEQAAPREEAEANEQGERHAAAKRDDETQPPPQVDPVQKQPPQVDPVQKCKSLNELSCAQKCFILPTEWMDQAAKGPTVIFDPALLDLCLEGVGHLTADEEKLTIVKNIYFSPVELNYEEAIAMLYDENGRACSSLAKEFEKENAVGDLSQTTTRIVRDGRGGDFGAESPVDQGALFQAALMYDLIHIRNEISMSRVRKRKSASS